MDGVGQRMKVYTTQNPYESVEFGVALDSSLTVNLLTGINVSVAVELEAEFEEAAVEDCEIDKEATSDIAGTASQKLTLA